MMHKLFTRLFVVPVTGPAVDHRVVTGFVCCSEVTYGDGCLRCRVGCRGSIVVPGRARSLVGWVVIFHTKLPVQPENRGRIARDVTALPTALMVPGKLARNAFRASILGHDFGGIIRDTLHDPLALSFEFEELFSNIFRGRIGRITLEDTLRNGATSDGGHGNGNFAGHITSIPV